MHPLSGPLLVAMLVLAMGGLAKLTRPDDTAGALRALGLPSDPRLVRLLGLVEIGLGLGSLVSASALFPALAGGMYLAFTWFVLVALKRGAPIQSCGCFGRIDTPPSKAHVITNVTAAGIALSAAATPGGSVLTQLAEHPAEAVPLLALTGVGLYLVYVALTALPQTMAEVGRRTP